MNTRFNLADFLGQWIQIRWVAESWVFDGNSSSYFELGSSWGTPVTHDDGWWLDDIHVIGTIEEQFTPAPDTDASIGGVCLRSNAGGTLTAGRDAGLKAARDEFYMGEIAESIVDFQKKHDGLIGRKDLAAYES